LIFKPIRFLKPYRFSFPLKPIRFGAKIASMTIEQIFDAFNHLKVLIIGDVMVDSYVWGQVERISPEAPVPVVNVKKQEKRLGGAANVALNVQALGATPILCAIVGDDDEAKTVTHLLEQQNMTTQGIIRQKRRITTVKHRILAGSQQLLRIDNETDTPINEEEENILLAKFQELAVGVNVIIFEDYDKGVLTPSVIEKIIAWANTHQIPTVVDPKKRNFWSYQKATLFKPNLKELREGLKIEIDANNLESLATAVATFRDKMQLDTALITLSERGVFALSPQEKVSLPAHQREIADVSGAGDTVVSIAALCKALQLDLPTLAALSNLGGGLVCEHLGVVPINKQKLLAEAQKLF